MTLLCTSLVHKSSVLLIFFLKYFKLFCLTSLCRSGTVAGAMNREDFMTLREHYALSQEQIAEIIGVARPTVTRWENGTRQLTDKKLKKIVNILIEELGR
jgi:DNA-binding XRE family transcriptional regulator